MQTETKPDVRIAVLDAIDMLLTRHLSLQEAHCAIVRVAPEATQVRHVLAMLLAATVSRHEAADLMLGRNDAK